MDIPTVEQALIANGLHTQATAYAQANTDSAIRSQMVSRFNHMFNCELNSAMNTLVCLWGIAATITIGFGLIVVFAK